MKSSKGTNVKSRKNQQFSNEVIINLLKKVHVNAIKSTRKTNQTIKLR